jgi:hypothetical protein
LSLLRNLRGLGGFYQPVGLGPKLSLLGQFGFAARREGVAMPRRNRAVSMGPWFGSLHKINQVGALVSEQSCGLGQSQSLTPNGKAKLPKS